MLKQAAPKVPLHYVQQLDSYTVSQHWLPAIINDDTTGLSDEEEQQLDAFMARETPDEFTIWRCDDSTFYTRDEITGLFAMCVELEAWG